MKETQEIILAALTKITDERAERTPVIITYPSHWDDEGSLYLALTPSQLALLEILRNSDVFDAEVDITLLADIDWQMP